MHQSTLSLRETAQNSFQYIVCSLGLRVDISSATRSTQRPQIPSCEMSPAEADRDDPEGKPQSHQYTEGSLPRASQPTPYRPQRSFLDPGSRTCTAGLQPGRVRMAKNLASRCRGLSALFWSHFAVQKINAWTKTHDANQLKPFNLMSM